MPNLVQKVPERVDSVALAHAVSIRSFQGARTESRQSNHDDLPLVTMSNLDLTSSIPEDEGMQATQFSARDAVCHSCKTHTSCNIVLHRKRGAKLQQEIEHRADEPAVQSALS